MIKAAIQNEKKHNFQSSKKNNQRTHHPLIRVGRKKERGVMMKAAIQNTKLKRYKFRSSEKNIQGTHHSLIRVGRKKERSNDESSHSKQKKRHNFQSSKKNNQRAQHPLIRVGRKKRGE